MRKKVTEQSGFIVVETAIVFLISFLVVLLLYAMVHIMYEQVRINAIARDAAERGAIIYTILSKDMVTGRIAPDEYEDTYNVYWRLWDSNKQARINRVKNYLQTRLNSYLVSTEGYSTNISGSANVSPENAPIYVNVKNYFIYKRMHVKLAVPYKAPLGGVLTLFGLEYPYIIRAEAEASIPDPAEMIRNVDFARDILVERTKWGGQLSEKWQNGLAKIRDLIG